MKLTLTVISASAISIFSASALASDNHAHAEHGGASVEINVQGNKAQVAFESSTEDIYGIANEAKTDEEKKKVDAAMNTLKTKMGEMVIFDPKLGCKWTATDAQPWVVHGEKKANEKEQHGEAHAKFDVECSAPLAGTRAKFAVKKNFPTINAVKVKVTTGGKSTSTEIKRDRGTVTL
jgi:hypothetical protein